MARVNAISEGQPLTYDLINEIINQVNQVKELPDDFGQSVEVYGPDIGMSDQDTVKIVTGSEDFAFGVNDSSKSIEIKFKPQKNKNGVIFSKNQVIVVASVVDTEINKAGGGIQMANLTITSITKSGFEATVQILKADSKKKLNMTVNYIAIGAGPRIK